ncbi:MAG: hypothetical protein Q9227_006376 [Pyrenula ochraceoflavens]
MGGGFASKRDFAALKSPSPESESDPELLSSPSLSDGEIDAAGSDGESVYSDVVREGGMWPHKAQVNPEQPSGDPWKGLGQARAPLLRVNYDKRFANVVQPRTGYVKGRASEQKSKPQHYFSMNNQIAIPMSPTQLLDAFGLFDGRIRSPRSNDHGDIRVIFGDSGSIGGGDITRVQASHNFDLDLGKTFNTSLHFNISGSIIATLNKLPADRKQFIENGVSGFLIQNNVHQLLGLRKFFCKQKSKEHVEGAHNAANDTYFEMAMLFYILFNLDQLSVRYRKGCPRDLNKPYTRQDLAKLPIIVTIDCEGTDGGSGGDAVGNHKNPEAHETWQVGISVFSPHRVLNEAPGEAGINWIKKLKVGCWSKLGRADYKLKYTGDYRHMNPLSIVENFVVEKSQFKPQIISYIQAEIDEFQREFADERSPRSNDHGDSSASPEVQHSPALVPALPAQSTEAGSASPRSNDHGDLPTSSDQVNRTSDVIMSSPEPVPSLPASPSHLDDPVARSPRSNDHGEVSDQQLVNMRTSAIDAMDRVQSGEDTDSWAHLIISTCPDNLEGKICRSPATCKSRSLRHRCENEACPSYIEGKALCGSEYIHVKVTCRAVVLGQACRDRSRCSESFGHDQYLLRWWSANMLRPEISLIKTRADRRRKVLRLIKQGFENEDLTNAVENKKKTNKTRGLKRDKRVERHKRVKAEKAAEGQVFPK